MSSSKLEPVVPRRQRRVDELRLEYADLLDRLREEEARGDTMQALLLHTLNAVARQLDETIAPQELDAYYRFVAHQSTAIRGQRSALDQLRAVCEEKRRVLLQAKQDERVIAELERAHQEARRRAFDTREQHADEFLSHRTSMKGAFND